MQIILNPAQFDVVLTENMFGDIISDEASVISGSLGLLPSASIGKGAGLFEPIHGSYPQAAGKDIANPLGSILSTAMLLDHLGLAAEAKAVREAVNWSLAEGIVTQDLDPNQYHYTSQVGDLISARIEDEHAPGTGKRRNRLCRVCRLFEIIGGHARNFITPAKSTEQVPRPLLRVPPTSES